MDARRGSVTQTVVNIVLLLLLVPTVGALGYFVGYQRGCEDTLNTVEKKAEEIAKRLGFN